MLVLHEYRHAFKDSFLLVDSGYTKGYKKTNKHKKSDGSRSHFFAKLIFSGKTREEARHTAIDALSKIEVDGVRTNRDFLISCLRHRDYVEGKIHTTFVHENIECLIKGNVSNHQTCS